MEHKEIVELLSLSLSEQHSETDNLIIKRRKSMIYNKEACVEFLEYAAIEIDKSSFKGLNPLLANVLSTAFTNAARVMRERGCSTDNADREAALKEIGKELGITNGNTLLAESAIGQEFQSLMMSGVYRCSKKNCFVYPDDLEIRKKLANKYGVQLDTLTKKVRKCEKKWKAEQDERSINIGVGLVENFFDYLKKDGVNAVSHEDLHRFLTSMLERNFSAYEKARDWCRRVPSDESDFVLRAACKRKILSKSVDGVYTKCEKYEQ
ncbi:hypothetical protein O4N73_20580 [Vibrio parahaemolyticus]|uniref:hypothetical protein n=1 Tax=Vibrio parahaemolyticus TaxID=670 RepID=UPI0022B42071|nr:hypothetical protein [Vibrio parahaemolyticus]MCZ5880133.1 hypothetical protein [Vibrio parahaemolyticus]MCZ6371571.1 hypothetical protein [Vibrio parahaemolyticus]